MATLESILSQAIVQRIGWTLVHFLWQGAAVAIILAIVLRILKNSSANVRYVVTCAALLLMVVMPIATFPIIRVDSKLSTLQMVRPTVSDENLKSEILNPKQIQISKSQMQIEETSLQQTKGGMGNKLPILRVLNAVIERALPYMVVGWLFGVFGLSLWHLGGWTQLQRLRRRMVKPVDPSLRDKLNELAELLHIRRAVEAAESALVQVPTVIGWLRPIILLPASAVTGLSGEQLEAILAHELAHIRRHDYLVNMLQTAVEILGFFHPAVWWVSGRIRLERENCCDDAAVSICGDRICYAKALATMEEIRGGRLELAVAASGGSLFERIGRLMGKRTAEKERAGWMPSIIAVVLVMAILVTTVFAMSSRAKTGDLTTKSTKNTKENEFKTVTLAVVDESSLDKVDSVTASLFDFSSEKIINITLDLKGLSEREKGGRFFNKLFAANADLLISNDGKIVVFGPSTAEFKGMTLKDISKIGVKRLAAHVRAEERRRPPEFINIPFWNRWLDTGEVGVFLTEDGLVVAIQAGEFVAGSKKGEFKYIIVGRVDPKNLPEPNLIKELVVHNELIGVLEYPEFIKNSAKELFRKIQTADYNHFLNSKDPQTWKEFPIVESYKAYKDYPELVRWIGKTFKENPIVSIELGEVIASEKDWPTIKYTLILKDESRIEGNLRFEYLFSDGLNGRWYGIHGIDWHLQDEPIKKPDVQGGQNVNQQPAEPNSIGVEQKVSADKKNTFGPQIEVTVPVEGTRVGTFYLDFESGQVVSPPPALSVKDREAGFKWGTDSGVDVMAEELTTGPRLWGIGCVFTEIMPDRWQTIMPKELLAQVNAGYLKGEAAARDPKQLPATFIFKTREGGIGVLQILGFSDEPKGVKIRYKMVHRVSDPNQQPAEANSVSAASLAEWSKQLSNALLLKDGEVLKRIPSPYLQIKPGVFTLPFGEKTPPPASMVYVVPGDVNTRHEGMTSNGVITLDKLLNTFLAKYEYSGTREILNKPVPGYWVIRSQIDKYAIMNALEKVLNEEPNGLRIKFKKARSNDNVIVARGTYKFTTLEMSGDSNFVQVFSDVYDPHNFESKSQTIAKFIDWLGNEIDMPVMDKTDSSKEKINWKSYSSAKLYNGCNDMRTATDEVYKQRLAEVLSNLTKQTGLTFTEEKAATDVWKITSDANSVPAGQ